MTGQWDARARADLALRPTKSQVFLVGLLVVGALSFVGAFVSAFFNRPLLSTVGFVIGAGVLWAALGAWRTSQADIDREGGVPTIFTATKSRVVFQTDSRALASPQMREAADQILRSMQNFLYRQALPEPRGLISQTGEPVVGSKDQAAKVVQSINAQTQQLHAGFSDVRVENSQSAGVPVPENIDFSSEAKAQIVAAFSYENVGPPKANK